MIPHSFIEIATWLSLVAGGISGALRGIGKRSDKKRPRDELAARRRSKA